VAAHAGLAVAVCVPAVVLNRSVPNAEAGGGWTSFCVGQAGANGVRNAAMIFV